MKNLPRLLVVLIYLLCTISTHAQTPPEQARNYQINETHTGSISVPGLTPPLQEKWRREFGRIPSYPIIADGRVFVSVASQFSTGLGSILYVLDQNTGGILWLAGISSRFPWSALCYENGRIFTLSSEGVLRAYDAATGNLIWSILFPGGHFSAPPTVYQGVIYASGNDDQGSGLYAVSAATGNVLWRLGLDGSGSSPALTSEGLYVSFSCLNIYKLNPLTGSQIWRYRTGCTGGGGAAPVLYNGSLYVNDFTDTIFDSQTGTVTGNFNSRGLPVFSGNLGFFLNAQAPFYGPVEARDVATNNVVWSFAGDGSLQSPLLVVNDYVYVGSAQGKLSALNATTGEEVWSNTAGASIPYQDDLDQSHPTTGFAAAEGLLLVPTSTALVAYERDHTPPTVTWGVPSPAANASGWYNSPVDFPFTPSDSGSGVASSLPESPLHFTVEGANQTQQVTLTDNLGNTGTVTSPPLNIDLSAPTSSIVVSGPQANGWYRPGAAQISLSATDSLSGVKDTFYSINEGATFPYVTPFSLFPDGTFTVNFWSTDRAGNTESRQSRIVKVDAIAPTTQASVPGITPAGWYYNPAQVTLTASDSGSGVVRTSFMIDGGPEQTYTGPFNVSGDSYHQVAYWSTDAVGNVEVQRSFTILVDAFGPSTQTSISGTAGTNGWYRSAVQVSLAASDTVSGVQTTFYKVDGGTTKTYVGTAFNVSGNGSHTVNYWSVDKAGNTEAMRTLTISIDTNLPNVSANATPGSISQGPNPVTVTVSGRVTDNTSGVLTSSVTFSVVDEYGVTQPSGSVVLQPNGTYSFTLSFPATRNTGDPSHVYTITVRAVDLAGNVDTHSDTVKITS